MGLRNFMMLTIIVVIALVAVACGNGGAYPEPENIAEAPTIPEIPVETPAENPSEDIAENREAVVWLTAAESAALDPIVQNDQLTADLTAQIFEGLMWYGPGNVLEPQLAESYEIIDDANLVYQFNLRSGVTFHDGTPFTAEAVKISIDRLLDPDNASPGASILEMINEVVVVDDYTVQIILQYPFSPFTAHLTHMVGSIHSPASIAEGTTNEHPIGTGPFMFEYRVSGDYTRMIPNPNHWRKTPVHDLIFRVIPDPAIRLAMIDDGEAHAFAGLASHIYDLNNMPHVDWWRIPQASLTYIGFNTDPDTRDGARDEMTAQALADPRVRRAITMAINATEILYDIQKGEGVLAVGPIRGGLVTHAPIDVPGLAFDPDAARELLAEAGFPEGFSLSIWTNEGDTIRASICGLVQANLAVIGIELDVHTIEGAVYLNDTAAGLHDMFLMDWVTTTGDADYGILPLFHSNGIGGTNRTHYTSLTIDRLLEEARMSVDPVVRDDLYRQITEILVYDAPMIFLFHPDIPVVTNGIDGMIFDFTATPFFHEVTLR